MFCFVFIANKSYVRYSNIRMENLPNNLDRMKYFLEYIMTHTMTDNDTEKNQCQMK